MATPKPGAAISKSCLKRREPGLSGRQKKCHARGARKQLFDYLKLLPEDIPKLAGNSGDVTTGSCEACDEGGTNRVTGAYHDDWNGLGLVVDGLGALGVAGDNDGRLERNQLGRGFPRAFGATLSGPVNKFDISTLDPSALLQFLQKYLPNLSNLRVGQWKLSEDRYMGDRGLRCGRQRESDKARAKKPD